MRSNLFVSLAGAAASIIFVTTKVCLSRQNFCCCCAKHIFVVTKVLSRQTRACCDKKRLLSQQKYALSRQNLFSRDKHNLVATSILLSRQKTCFVVTNTCLSLQTHVCHNKSFVTTKMILVAAPANDTFV